MFIRQFMINSPVCRILHGEHPPEVIKQLIDNIGDIVGVLRDGDVQCSAIFRVELIEQEQGVVGYTAVDNVFIVIAGIIPSSGAGDDRSRRSASWTQLMRGRERQYQDGLPGVPILSQIQG